VTPITSPAGNRLFRAREREISKAVETQIANMQVGKPLLLEVQRDESRAYGYTYIAKYRADIDGSAESWQTVACVSSLLLKGKLLMISAYSKYRDDRDLQWLRATCREFVDGVIAAN
jgi:hypothetical protein